MPYNEVDGVRMSNRTSIGKSDLQICEDSLGCVGLLKKCMNENYAKFKFIQILAAFSRCDEHLMS